MGGGWGIHISLAAILEGIHISLVTRVWGYTYHGDTHNHCDTPIKVRGHFGNIFLNPSGV